MGQPTGPFVDAYINNLEPGKLFTAADIVKATKGRNLVLGSVSGHLSRLVKLGTL